MNQIFVYNEKVVIWKGRLDYIPKIGEMAIFRPLTNKNIKICYSVYEVNHLLDLNKVHIFVGKETEAD